MTVTLIYNDSQTTGMQTTALEDDTNDETDTQEDLDSLPHLSLDLEEIFVYHSHISDEKRQDARTTFANAILLVQNLRDKGILLPGMTLDEVMDGCGKQCRSATSLYFMSCLAVMFGIVVKRSIQAPGHGKGICDAIGGIDKNYLRQFSAI